MFPDDIYYETGKIPKAEFRLEDNDLNYAYITVQKRYEGYKKFGGRAAAGLDAYDKLKPAVDAKNWKAVLEQLDRGGVKIEGGGKTPPAPAFAGLRVAGLLASTLLVDAERTGIGYSTYVSRFYINEIDSALQDLKGAAETSDAPRALAAWENGRVAWNSLTTILNPQITDKVGDKLRTLTEEGYRPPPPPAAVALATTDEPPSESLPPPSSS